MSGLVITYFSIIVFYRKDGDVLDSEKTSPNDKVSVNREVFRDLKANNCSYYPNLNCSDSAGTRVADLGVWDKALSYEEMVGWTTCRYCKEKLAKMM